MKDILSRIPQMDYPCRSRIHRLSSFQFADCACYVKRDDELGFGISGSKIRKYRSLIPELLKRKINHTVIIGSAYSNNVLGISQLLIENGIVPRLLLRGENDRSLTGNALFTSLFVPKESIHWISRQEWPQVEAIAEDHARQLCEQGERVFVLPEGASVEAALPGALTLPLDILRNEEENHLEFDHLFVEAGTGMMASILILAFAALKKKCKIHVVLLGEGEAAFWSRLTNWHENLERFLAQKVKLGDTYDLHRPRHAASFGSVNARIFEEIKAIAMAEGFLTDPVYSAKLFLEARNIIAERQLKGNILIMHSGGALALAGFQRVFTKL